MANQKPVAEVRIGRVKATIWLNGSVDVSRATDPTRTAANSTPGLDAVIASMHPRIAAVCSGSQSDSSMSSMSDSTWLK